METWCPDRSPLDWMICILQLLLLTFCVRAETFVVNVTQSSYQAEENANITLEWTFTNNAGSSPDSIYIFCELITDQQVLILFHLHGGDEVQKSQDEKFAGRVQFDKDVLREGRVRLHVSRLRTEDSGLYRCEVLTDDGTSADRCRLNVTAAADESKTQRPTVRPQPERRGRISLFVGMSAALLAVCGLCFAFRLLLMRKKRRLCRCLDSEQKNPLGLPGPCLSDSRAIKMKTQVRN